MLKLASIVFLNPRPLLQPNEAERKIIRKIEKRMLWKFRLGLLGIVLLVVGMILLPLLIAA